MLNSDNYELIQKLQLEVQSLEQKNADCEKLRADVILKLMISEDRERRLKNNKRDLKRRLKCTK
jgi:hypothetical protein